MTWNSKATHLRFDDWSCGNQICLREQHHQQLINMQECIGNLILFLLYLNQSTRFARNTVIVPDNAVESQWKALRNLDINNL